METAVEFHTDLLKNISGVFGKRTERTRYRVDQALVAADELLPSVLFLSQTRLNQVVVWGIHFGNLNLRSNPNRREIAIRRFRMDRPNLSLLSQRLHYLDLPLDARTGINAGSAVCPCGIWVAEGQS